MKYIVLAVFLICSFAVHAQQKITINRTKTVYARSKRSASQCDSMMHAYELRIEKLEKKLARQESKEHAYYGKQRTIELRPYYPHKVRFPQWHFEYFPQTDDPMPTPTIP